MRFRNWLLTGTSIGLMAMLPLSVRAQDGDLVAAYQAYTAAQASGDAEALAAAEGSFTEACIVAGYASIDECIAAAAGGGAAAPAEPAAEPAPAEAAPEEAAPAPAEEAAPEAAPEPEVVPAPEPAPEPAMEAAPEPAAESAAPEPAPAAESTPEAEPAPAPAEAEPAPEPAPAAEPAPVEAPAPAAEEAPAPVAEPAPAEPAAEAAPAAPTVDISAELQGQVDLYNAAIADMMSGGDQVAAQDQMASAKQNITDLCAQAGMDDITACLANYGLELPVVPNMDEPAAPAPAAAVEPAEQAEPIEELPAGVTQDQVAPVLDSDKDPEQPAAADAAEQPAPEAAVEAEAEAAPTSDANAQRSFQSMEVVAPVTAEEGQAIEAAAIEPQSTPQNVTIINQTNVTNNNTTNIDNTGATIGQQQNNVVTEQSTSVATGQASSGEVQPLDPGQVITQMILQVGSQLIVNSVGQDTDRFYNAQEDEIFYENLSRGRVRETITRPDGSQIVTVRNRNGDVLRRSRIDPDGREYVLAYFDDRYDNDLNDWRDPGQDLPPLRLNIPVRDYVLDADEANEQQVETFFSQPPVEQVARLYSIDEVKRSARIRDSVRKLEVGGLTFDTGAATISRDQVSALSNVANAMLQLLDRNPGETFLIEGHTDAVGSEISNLQLSDLRAATVARILTDFYDVPPENLATQGYGERYLKIRTEAAERANRRVTIRRITPLITVANK